MTIDKILIYETTWYSRSANGNRTRISALRGRRPEPLDDSAKK